MSEDAENFLEHFGVKGMKWGVRQNRGAAVSNKNVRTNSKANNKQTAVNKSFRERYKNELAGSEKNLWGLSDRKIKLEDAVMVTAIVAGKKFAEYLLSS
jgi:hypothetical protein